MPAIKDGPASSLFKPVTFKGNASLEGLLRFLGLED